MLVWPVGLFLLGVVWSQPGRSTSSAFLGVLAGLAWLLLGVESAGQLERVDVVGRVDEDGRGTPLTQPAGHRVEPGLPSRDRTCRVVPAEVADDGMRGQGP